MAETLYKNKPHDENLRNALHLKWAIRVKPDIVIELNGEEVVCIEAKMESGEALYPSGTDRSKLIQLLGHKDHIKFYERTQLDIQDMLMRNILGFRQIHYVFLTKGGSSQRTRGAEEKVAVKCMSWQQALEGLELGKEARSALKREWGRMRN
jgi:hypothetical protein